MSEGFVIYSYNESSGTVVPKTAIGETADYFYVPNKYRRGGKERIAKKSAHNHLWTRDEAEAVEVAIAHLTRRQNNAIKLVGELESAIARAKDRLRRVRDELSQK